MGAALVAAGRPGWRGDGRARPGFLQPPPALPPPAQEEMRQLNQNYLQDNGPLFALRQMLSVGTWCFMRPPHSAFAGCRWDPRSVSYSSQSEAGGRPPLAVLGVWSRVGPRVGPGVGVGVVAGPVIKAPDSRGRARLCNGLETRLWCVESRGRQTPFSPKGASSPPGWGLCSPHFILTNDGAPSLSSGVP